jgi:hypothetical protein
VEVQPVKDVIGGSTKTAARRRDQSNQEKSSSVSGAWIHRSWAFKLVEKSLWYRIHRRKQQMVFFDRHQVLIK